MLSQNSQDTDKGSKDERINKEEDEMSYTRVACNRRTRGQRGVIDTQPLFPVFEF